MSRPRGLPHSIRHTGIEYTFLPEVYMYTTLARTHTHGHETTSLRSVMSGAVARTTESNSAMTFEHSGMPSYAPGDSALESRGADWLRTAKLSQNSSSDVWAPTDCPTQLLPAELSDSNLPSGKCSESEESIEGTAKQGTSNIKGRDYGLDGVFEEAPSARVVECPSISFKSISEDQFRGVVHIGGDQ